MKIPGYFIIRNDRNNEGGGVLLAVKEQYKNITTEVARINDIEESLWITIGSRTVYQVGIIYVAKGDGEKKDKLQKMYNRITQEVGEAKLKSKNVLVMGDFNCKVGEVINGNKREISKGRKMMLKMSQNSEMQLANTWKGTNGLWTRREGENKSVIDYIIMQKEHMTGIQEMEVDEEKEWTPFRVIKQDGILRTIYTDHNAIKCEIDWKIENNRTYKEKFAKKMTKKGYQK